MRVNVREKNAVTTRRILDFKRVSSSPIPSLFSLVEFITRQAEMGNTHSANIPVDILDLEEQLVKSFTTITYPFPSAWVSKKMLDDT